jgi:hypothetical protein
MLKKLHIKTPIFFENPIVCRTVFSSRGDLTYALSHCRKLSQDTWGFSYAVDENLPLIIYWCFSNELDCLQFSLSVNAYQISKVLIWPKTLFTITEITY